MLPGLRLPLTKRSWFQKLIGVQDGGWEGSSLALGFLWSLGIVKIGTFQHMRVVEKAIGERNTIVGWDSQLSVRRDTKSRKIIGAAWSMINRGGVEQ